MRQALLFFIISTFAGIFKLSAQSLVSTSPSIFTADQSVTITYDATQGNAGLTGVSSVHMHAGVILSGSTGTVWSNVVGQWGNPASAGQMTSLGGNKWQITIPNVRTYFGVATGVPIYRIGMVFRESGPCGGFGGASANCKEGKTAAGTDIFIEVSQGGFDVAFSAPVNFPIFKNAGETLSITASASQSSSLSIKVNGIEKAQVASAATISYDHIVAESGLVTVLLTANNGTETKERSFTYLVRSAAINQSRPVGLANGINYNSSDPSKATLVFLAPQKSSVYVVGDFNDWKILPSYQMKKDGEYFWLELIELTSGSEYAFQYLVDENLYVADPYSEKILDPSNDQFIPITVYPNLKAYPSGKATGIVSVLQTGQTDYVWQASNYIRPDKEKLIVYELLVRDFETDKSFQGAINRLDYLKDLGINAIELMPIMEFSGNNSWGYNPIFYFAPDKAYGTKNKLKELIDKAHERGIAVILDMVLNQADFEFPYVKMYWDNGKPATTNPWFNRDATHPFNVFFDFNHDSPYTENLVDDINKYWITEYKFDGFRFDLSKGFTQTVNTDVGAWSGYDQSRIDNLTRMANKIWETDTDCYVILEHLGVDSEEAVLANNGMMLWGIMHEAYKQNSLGFSGNSDISRSFYKNRSATWNNPESIVAYMESHDEQRIMYDNIQFGSKSGSYDIKSLPVALERVKAASAFLYSIPGPKMIWQFGELGYEVSIDFNGRTGEKPIRWEYNEDVSRQRLRNTISHLFKLKSEYSVFNTESVVIQGGTSLSKQIVLKSEPYTATPTSMDDMNVVIVGNFDVVPKAISANFPHTGQWYDYFSQEEILDATVTPFALTLQPGEFRIYSDIVLPLATQELTAFAKPIKPILNSLLETSDGVRLMWEDNSSVESAYSIFRRQFSESNFELIEQLPSNSVSFVDGSAEASQTYQYYVTATGLSYSTSSDTLEIVTTDVITESQEKFEDKLIYPNPVDNELTIDVSNTVTQLRLFSLSGKLILPPKISTQTWDVSSINAGMYIAEIVTRNRTIRTKLIKN
jgi:1,4-alpha-glucan branching enzyme